MVYKATLNTGAYSLMLNTGRVMVMAVIIMNNNVTNSYQITLCRASTSARLFRAQPGALVVNCPTDDLCIVIWISVFIIYNFKSK